MVLVHTGQPDPQVPGAQAAGRAGRQPLSAIQDPRETDVRGVRSPESSVSSRSPLRTLVLGGTRSGKSGYAEELLPADAPVRYLATARRHPGDAEWDARIDAHRARRPQGWTTVEEPDVGALVRAGGGPLLVDDLATWLTGVLDDAGAWDRPVDITPRVDALVDAVRAAPGRVVLVSAEVGLGVVPSTPAGRLFRDELGALNAALARVCDEVVLLVAGLPLHLKRIGAG